MSDTTKDAVLLPCPFCGGHAKQFEESLDERFAYANKVTIRCSGCDVGVSATGIIPSGGYADNSTTGTRAEAAWNRRAPAQVQAEAVRVDERAAFENWCETYAGLGMRDFKQTGGGAYISGYVDDMWDGWKARAGLTAPSTGDQS